MFKAEASYSVEPAAGKCIAGAHHGPDGRSIRSETGTQLYSKVSQTQTNAPGWETARHEWANLTSAEYLRQAVGLVIVKKATC